MKASSTLSRTIERTIDIDVDGKQHGHFIVPCPTTTSAHGAAQIPVCVVRNGEGPVVSLLAGAHGDEYDGRIALHRLINAISPEDIKGTLIIAVSYTHLTLPTIYSV